MPRKKPRTGLMIVFVALGAGAVGFIVGGVTGGDGEPVRSARTDPRPAARFVAAEAEPEVDFWDQEADLEEPVDEGEVLASVAGATPAELLDGLRRHAGSERSQIMLVGIVADAARRGGAALPELRELLESGVDIKFPSYSGQGLGYPSLRVALMAAAEATGDPEAAKMIAQVAQTTESPVEVVFSAHLLDRLDALDAQTAQRTLDSLTRPLTPDQRKAIGAVVGKVVPAAAAADPGYAEQFLYTQLRLEKGQGANPRVATAVLQGLPRERARDLVLATMTAADVSDANKRYMASRAAQRKELSMLSDLRQAIESRRLAPKVAAAVANSAVGGRAWSSLERSLRRELSKGNLDQARKYAARYRDRLAETEATITAARGSGARLRHDIGAQTQVRRKRLDMLRGQLAKAYRRQQQKAQQQAKKNAQQAKKN